MLATRPLSCLILLLSLLPISLGAPNQMPAHHRRSNSPSDQTTAVGLEEGETRRPLRHVKLGDIHLIKGEAQVPFPNGEVHEVKFESGGPWRVVILGNTSPEGGMVTAGVLLTQPQYYTTGGLIRIPASKSFQGCTQDSMLLLVRVDTRTLFDETESLLKWKEPDVAKGAAHILTAFEEAITHELTHDGECAPMPTTLQEILGINKEGDPSVVLSSN